MFEKIALFPILGKPAIMWGGLVTAAFFLTTFYLGLKRSPLKIHRAFAYTTLALALIHGFLGLALTFF
jgi:hypothetical protein